MKYDVLYLVSIVSFICRQKNRPIGIGVFVIGFGMGIPFECDMSFLMFLIPHRILFCDDQAGVTSYCSGWKVTIKSVSRVGSYCKAQRRGCTA